MRSVDITRALKVSMGGLPSDWRNPLDRLDVHVIPGYAPWRLIFSLTTLA